VALNKANTKALADLAQAISEGGQALARKQAEIIQKNAEEITKYFKDATSLRSPEAGIAKHADFTKSAVDSAIANSSELLEISNKCNNEAREIITKRVSSVITELTQPVAKNSVVSESSKDTRRKAEAA